MAAFFNGWIGYGTAVAGGVLAEPADPAYARRPYVLGDMDNGIVRDVGSGTAGPATVGWGTIGYAGLFDAQTGGNLLLWMPLPAPCIVGVGNTITSDTGAFRYCFPGLQSPAQPVVVWPAGSLVAWTQHRRWLTAGVSLQVSAGVMSAQTLAFGATVTMANLPPTQASSGSGQLWNNGGIISVS